MSQLVQDIRYAFRQLLRAPGFAATAILTLAFGIGVNAAAFTLIYGMLLRPLPVPAPDQLYRLGDTFTCCSYVGLSNKGDFDIFSYGNYLYLRKTLPEFQGLAAIQSGEIARSVKSGNDTPKALVVTEVSANYFDTYSVTPYLGRLLSDADDQTDAVSVAVLSYAAWQTEFNSDAAVIGKTVLIQSHPFRIVGIAQRGFFGERISDRPPAIWIPLASDSAFYGLASQLRRPGSMWLWLVGRVRPGTDIPALQTKVSEQTRQWLTSTPDSLRGTDRERIARQHVVLTRVAAGIQDMVSNYTPGLKLLLILSSVVLLVACANIANLLLARGVARRDDLAIRMALGASRGRIIRQMFTESLLLSLIAGGVALSIASAASYLTLRLGFPEATALPVAATPSLPVLAFALLVSVVIGLLFGAAPARLSMLADPAEVMRGSRQSIRGASELPQKILLVLQAVLCAVLLTVAVLATRWLYHLVHQPNGFDPTDRYVIRFDPTSSGIPLEHWPELYSQIESRFSKLDGGTPVGLVQTVPYSGFETADCIFIKVAGPEGKLINSAGQCGVAVNQANAAYLEVMGTGVTQGRNFSSQDTAASSPVAIVSQSFAQRFFPGQSPLGRRFERSPSDSSNTWEIIGVYPDMKIEADNTALPTYILSSLQWRAEHEVATLGAIVVHLHHPSEGTISTLRRTLSRVDPDLMITSLETMDSMIDGSVNNKRIIAWLSVVFGLLAILLASVGLYGVTNYIAAQRIHEIGIRMALGATRAGVIRHVMRSVLVPVAVGLVLGIPSSLLAAYSIKGLLYRLPWFEPIGLIAVTLLLGICATAAALIPARRAASIEPMAALRVE